MILLCELIFRKPNEEEQRTAMIYSLPKMFREIIKKRRKKYSLIFFNILSLNQMKVLTLLNICIDAFENL